MSLAQDRLVIAGLLLSESAWLFALGGLLGVTLGEEGGPMGWLGVLAIMSASLLVTRTLQSARAPMTWAYGFQMAAGVIVIYLTVATQVTGRFEGLDLGWLGTTISGAELEGYTFRAAVGSVLGAALWWRGGHLGAVESPVESLNVSFKVGVMVLAIVAIVDILHPSDLGIFRMMFIFFGAGIAGLSVGHLLPATRQSAEQKTWGRVIGGVVAAIVVVGLLFSLLRGSALTLLVTPLTFVLNALATVLFFVVIVPLAWIISTIVQFFFWAFGRFANPAEAQPLTPQGSGLMQSLEDLREGTSDSPVAETFLQIGLWILVGIVALIALVILAKAFQRRSGWLRGNPDGFRESVREEANPALDLARLLFGLLPSRFRRRGRSEFFRLPDDDADIVDVFRVYFQMLTLAGARGHPRRPADTPIEYGPTLESVFPADLVRSVTDAFTRACYGRLPTPRPEIDHMTTSVEGIIAGQAPS